MNSRLMIVLAAVCMVPAAEGMIHNKNKYYLMKHYGDEYFWEDYSTRGRKLVAYEYGLSLRETTEELIKSVPCPEKFVAFENDPGSGYSYCFKPIFNALTHLPNLTHIFFKRARFTDFSGIEKLKNLVVLECKGNKELSSINGLEKLTQLKKLVLSGCSELNTLPYEPQIPSTLEHLEITNTKIKRLTGIKHLENLKILIASDNQIDYCSETAIPNTIEYLDLSFNQIDAINLDTYTRCKTIKLNNNRLLKAMPSGLVHLIMIDTLKEIDLDGNISPELLKNFIVQFKEGNKAYSHHAVILSLQKLLLSYVQYKNEIVMKKRNKIDEKLRNLEEMRKICLNDEDSEHK